MTKLVKGKAETNQRAVKVRELPARAQKAARVRVRAAARAM